MNNRTTIHVGREMYEELVAGGYLPDVAVWRRKMAVVPQHVHDAYAEEDLADFKNLAINGPHAGRGIVWYAAHPAEHRERMEWYKNRYPNSDSIWNKHYGPYGLNR